jgi:hypothetical protein
MKREARTGRGLTLLAAMLFLLAATSFHSGSDNDLARFRSDTHQIQAFGLATADTCAACTLDGLLSARLTMTFPVALPTAAESISVSIPPAPFVAPRAEVESRPPPIAS